jgi:hypothetical protein
MSDKMSNTKTEREPLELNHKVVSELFNFTKSTFYNWKKEQRPIISLLETYFTKPDLEEFLTTGKIQSLEEFLEFKKTAESNEEFKLFKQFQEFKKFQSEKCDFYYMPFYRNNRETFIFHLC